MPPPQNRHDVIPGINREKHQRIPRGGKLVGADLRAVVQQLICDIRLRIAAWADTRRVIR
jgi:hypothetical protein